MAKLKGGAVVARLSTAASGKVTNCTVVLSSGIAEVDATTCRFALQRAKYKPAIGADGRRTAATFTNYVTF
jgi:protein TonB